jgi:hypothetical protein
VPETSHHLPFDLFITASPFLPVCIVLFVHKLPARRIPYTRNHCGTAAVRSSFRGRIPAAAAVLLFMMDSPAVDIASPRSIQPASPTSQQSPPALAFPGAQDSKTIQQSEAAATVDELDPAAFLKSVRELSEKREREDNERYRKLEEEIEKGRQERLARKAGE